MTLIINKLKKEEVLTSYNFARNSDIVFSETVTHKQFQKLNIDNNLKIVFKNSYSILYVKKRFKLEENMIIFTNTYLLKNLFDLLKNIKSFKNIKIITHQTDLPITKSLYNSRPNCISEWYSINVDHENKNLIPIPLGLSNYYSPKNLFKENFADLNMNNSAKLKLYMNYKTNTNYKERKNLSKEISKNDWVVTQSHHRNIDNYVKDLNNFKFVLSPWGNGYDTHRFWETLYAGSIPVTKKHITYNCAEGLPVLYVDEYKNLTQKDLLTFLANINEEKIDYKKLDINYWVDLIKKNKYRDKRMNSHIIENVSLDKYARKYNSDANFENKKKKIYFRINQFKKSPAKLIKIIRK